MDKLPVHTHPELVMAVSVATTPSFSRLANTKDNSRPWSVGHLPSVVSTGVLSHLSITFSPVCGHESIQSVQNAHHPTTHVASGQLGRHRRSALYHTATCLTRSPPSSVRPPPSLLSTGPGSLPADAIDRTVEDETSDSSRLPEAVVHRICLRTAQRPFPPPTSTDSRRSPYAGPASGSWRSYTRIALHWRSRLVGAMLLFVAVVGGVVEDGEYYAFSLHLTAVHDGEGL
ncbi:hypothetical protein PHLGIDRAFT_118680 [Phlebiopsis gigantea 11061_1 CR5-6]|uniref:Uncharacterized protein n=1 Tax=Phlebiopsis gigantea (strain 11061_1 CR5-6) TaxID=745531 RepID=A0A0C3SA46_PHLG1|nr:hypothetical protein PHLGIDRAFT_118680 [Phlebiopsis gigantea 11061_1 CR5-6]